MRGQTEDAEIKSETKTKAERERVKESSSYPVKFSDFCY